MIDPFPRQPPTLSHAYVARPDKLVALSTNLFCRCWGEVPRGRGWGEAESAGQSSQDRGHFDGMLEWPIEACRPPRAPVSVRVRVCGVRQRHRDRDGQTQTETDRELSGLLRCSAARVVMRNQVAGGEARDCRGLMSDGGVGGGLHF